MGDDYWNSSSVRNKVNQQSIFDTDENNGIDVSYSNQKKKIFVFFYHLYLMKLFIKKYYVALYSF